jgi:predicted acylesterase/phospholipase RssA/CRP-like cAMP-binding protein
MTDDVITLLKVHEYFRSASDDALREVAAAGRLTHYAAGDVVHEADAPVTTVVFVLRGRLKAVRVDARGAESLFRMVERGEQYGMMAGALAEPVPIRVVALEPTTLLNLDYDEAMELTTRHPDLRRLWLSTYAAGVRKHFFGATKKHAPMVLALFHETPVTRPIAERLIDRLREVGEQLAVFSDSDRWRDCPGIRFRQLTVDSRDGSRNLDTAEIRRQIQEWQDASRIVFDLPTGWSPEQATRMLEFVDRVIYFVPTSAGDAAVRRLRALDVAARGWRDKLRIAWLLEGANPVGPVVPDLRELVARDFKISDTPPQHPWGRTLANGLERLVHDLRNVRVGVALGGGAARGMAHLGVLKVLEEAGIVVDMIAGTSAGALTGIVYASGLDSDYAADRFSADLTPSWIFRHLPQGNHWYLLHQYRRGKFDPMLRKYLHDWRLEQLVLPAMSVTVDLVSGKTVVRDRGDAIHAILESINIPVLSPPIYRSGQALIDGGLVNNIPADVLVALGCNFVIASSVSAKLETEFYNVTPETSALPRKRPSVLPTLLRSLQVQNYSLNAHGVQPADAMIQPDVTGFDLTEFMRAKELAAIGRSAGQDTIPRIRQLLTRLDPNLFPPQTTTPAD